MPRGLAIGLAIGDAVGQMLGRTKREQGRAFFARLVLTPRARHLSPAGRALARSSYLRTLEHELADALAAVPAVVRGAP